MILLCIFIVVWALECIDIGLSMVADKLIFDISDLNIWQGSEATYFKM